MFEFIDVKYKDFVDIPTLKIEKQMTTTLIGQSGSGKTTVLRMLNKMISPSQGRILYNSHDLSGINSVTVRRNVSMLSQTPAIFEGNVRDNLIAGLKFQEKELPCDELLVNMLEQVKLNKTLDSNCATLSGGEKQRLALGRILLLNSSVYLLDEPSSALDNQTEDTLIQMLVDHVRKESKTIIMVTHSKAVAEKFSDRIIEMDKGKITGERGALNEKRN